MITNAINTDLNQSTLEKELLTIQNKINGSNNYYFREKYIDRCSFDPFYIIRIKTDLSALGDDLLDEPLFSTPQQYIKMKHICRQSEEGNGNYWKMISGVQLNQRIDRFLDMYSNNYLQPAGLRIGKFNRTEPHSKFKGKRYLYEISTPWKTLTGLGPTSMTGLLTDGAIRGQITDFHGKSVEGIEVQLVMPNETITRQTEAGGLFWFARIPKGKYKLRLPHYSGHIHLFNESFGELKGEIRFINDNTTNQSVELEAPDGTIFITKTDQSGQLAPLKLPAFKYTIRIPNHLFKLSIRLEGNTIISGLLKKMDGQIISEAKILLLKQGLVIAKRVSTSSGNFRFELSEAGPYTLKVPGYSLFAKKIKGATLKGNIKDLLKPITLELIANDSVISHTQTNSNGYFSFTGLTKGNFKIRSQHADLRLDQQYELKGNISGTVKDEHDELMTSCVIQLFDEDQKLIATTTSDSSGKIAFETIPIGKYTIKSSGLIFQCDQHYPLLGKIKGLLINDAGKILKTQEIQLFQDGKNIVNTKTNAEGYFEIEDIPEGNYTIRYSEHSLKRSK